MIEIYFTIRTIILIVSIVISTGYTIYKFLKWYK